MISRQKVVGWILIIVSIAFIAWFLRVRLLGGTGSSPPTRFGGAAKTAPLGLSSCT